MNKIKIFIGSLFLIGILTNGSLLVKADVIDEEGATFIEAPTSSGTIGGFGKSKLLAVYASSNSASTPTNWFVILDTPGVTSGLDITSFSTANYKSPPMMFPVSTVTANTVNQMYWKVIDYGEEGISISSAPYVYKSAATSGMAQRVFLKIVPLRGRK